MRISDWSSDVCSSDLPRSVALAHGDNAVLRETGAQLAAYFTGALQAFDLPLKPIRTAFQREVWSTLAEIPYGETWSYGDVARRIGKPQAVRAVGAARSDDHTSALQSLMRLSHAACCSTTKNTH